MAGPWSFKIQLVPGSGRDTVHLWYYANLLFSLNLFIKFELQSMLIHCDVTRARTEACYDLPARTSVRRIKTISWTAIWVCSWSVRPSVINFKCLFGWISLILKIHEHQICVRKSNWITRWPCLLVVSLRWLLPAVSSLQTLQSLPVSRHCMNIHEPLVALGPRTV